MVFGWCLVDMSEAEHKKCRMRYRVWATNEIRECGCKCHKGKKMPDVPPERELESEKSMRKPRKKKSTK